MARHLQFTHADTTFAATLVKVDRSHLYGSVRVLTRNNDDKLCTVATLANDGKTLIPRGGTALGYVNPDGRWIRRDELQPVDLDGSPVPEVPSSFDAPIMLDTKASTRDLLDHSSRLSYRLEPKDEENFPAPWLATLADDDIYRFGFSYRGGVGYDPAFIVSDADGTVWMLITESNDIEFIGLEQAALCAVHGVTDAVDGDEDASDEIDFGML